MVANGLFFRCMSCRKWASSMTLFILRHTFCLYKWLVFFHCMSLPAMIFHQNTGFIWRFLLSYRLCYLPVFYLKTHLDGFVGHLRVDGLYQSSPIAKALFWFSRSHSARTAVYGTIRSIRIGCIVHESGRSCFVFNSNGDVPAAFFKSIPLK